MSKMLHYLFWMAVYLGFCFLCDIVFEEEFACKEFFIRVFSFLIAMTFIQISEKKGWNTWNKIIELFKRKG